MDAVYSKVVALLLLAVFTVVFGLIPAKVFRLIYGEHSPDEEAAASFTKRRQRRRLADLIISSLLYFGGGVLLATCFIHMIPEVRENFVAAAKRDTTGTYAFLNSHFPYPELMVCVGFFLVYIIEETVHYCICNGKHHHHSHTVGSCPGQAAETMFCTGSTPVPIVSNNNPAGDSSNYTDCQPEAAPLKPSGTASVPSGNGECATEKGGGDLLVTAGQPIQIQPNKAKYGSMETLPMYDEDAEVVVSAFRGLVIIIALSFHSIFEGMAIGLQEKSADVWTLFTAIAIHKFVIAFCVGMELMATGTRLVTMILYMTIFGLVSPVGVAVGIAVMESSLGSANQFVVGLFQGIAAGTLLYVTFFEVLQKDKLTKDRPSSRFIKLLCIIFGFSFLTFTHALEH